MGTTIYLGTDEHHKAEFENKNRTRQSHVSLDRRYGLQPWMIDMILERKNPDRLWFVPQDVMPVDCRIEQLSCIGTVMGVRRPIDIVRLDDRVSCLSEVSRMVF